MTGDRPSTGAVIAVFVIRASFVNKNRDSRENFQLVPRVYNPNFPALFSRNKLPSRMYRLTICTLRCPVWFIVETLIDGPPMAAAVRVSAIYFRK